MSGGFQFYDIIIFALIAVFIILRLRAVLGRRTGNERPNERDMFSRSRNRRDQSTGQVISLKGVDTQKDINSQDYDIPDDDDKVLTNADTPIASELRKIRQEDPDFSASEFVEGAKEAFSLIVSAFSNGDTPELRPLLGDDVYDEFASAIQSRLLSGNVSETSVISIDDVSLIHCEMRGTTARISIKFISQQTSVIRNDAGEVIDGDAEKILSITDVWTFSRNIRSSNPNWLLVETRSE